MPKTDLIAIALAQKWGMTPDLLVPIAARNLEAISEYIGVHEQICGRAYVIIPYNIPEPDVRFPVWKLKESEVFHNPVQVWVHVNYTGYRKSFQMAFPNANLNTLVIDHIMNRRVARLKGFEYLRVVAISRSANSSSGNMTEKYGFAFHSTERMIEFNSEIHPFIQYGDIADLIKMLNINTGGKVQEGILGALHYFEPE